jgi:hypothetical protein
MVATDSGSFVSGVFGSAPRFGPNEGEPRPAVVKGWRRMAAQNNIDAARKTADQCRARRRSVVTRTNKLSRSGTNATVVFRKEGRLRQSGGNASTCFGLDARIALWDRPSTPRDAGGSALKRRRWRHGLAERHTAGLIGYIRAHPALPEWVVTPPVIALIPPSGRSSHLPFRVASAAAAWDQPPSPPTADFPPGSWAPCKGVDRYAQVHLAPGRRTCSRI